jgi:sRNA-binding carbon storage regulator CsrA
MLVLQRKPGESIVLSSPDWTEDIIITITDQQPQRNLRKVKIAIGAPCDVFIARQELLVRTEQGEEVANAR